MGKTISFNIKDENLYKEAMTKAKSKQLSISALVRLALIEYLNK